MKQFFFLFLISIALLIQPLPIFAQTEKPTLSPAATKKTVSSNTEQIKIQATGSAQDINQFANPEQNKQRSEVLSGLIEKRHAENPTLFNFAPFAILYAIEAG